MGLNLGPSFGAGGRADALQEELVRRATEEMNRRRTAIMEQESQQRGQQQQIQNEMLARKVAAENVGMMEGTPGADIPYEQAEGPNGMGANVNVQDLTPQPGFNMETGRPQNMAPANVQASNRFKASPIPGVPSLGVGPGMLRAKTAEEAAAAKRAEALEELRMKTFNVGKDQRVVSPEFGVLAEGQAGETPEQKDAREFEQYKRQRDYAASHPIGGQEGGDGSGRPYFTYQPLYDKQGFSTGKVIRYDARGGPPAMIDVQEIGGGMPKPPPGTLGPQSIGNDVATSQLDVLIDLYNKGAKDDIGPLEGRARTFGQGVPGVPVSQRFATFDAASSAFRNAVIKAITGAQMSEPEANRIRQQIPETKDKPEVWIAKANKTRQNLQMLRERLESGAQMPSPGQPASAPSGARRVGDTKTLANGQKAAWDGTSWVIQ